MSTASAAASMTGSSRPILFAAVAIRPLRGEDKQQQRQQEEESEAVAQTPSSGSQQDVVSAIEAAAELAGVDDYAAERFGTPISPQQLVLEELGKNLQVSMPMTVENALVWIAPLQEPLAELSRLQDPKHVYLQCFDCKYAGQH